MTAKPGEKSKEQLRREGTADTGESELPSDPEEAAEQLEASAIAAIKPVDAALTARIKAIEREPLKGDPAHALEIAHTAHDRAVELYSDMREEVETAIHPDGSNVDHATASEATAEDEPIALGPDPDEELDAPTTRVETAQPDAVAEQQDQIEDEFFGRTTAYIPPEHRRPEDRPGAALEDKPLSRREQKAAAKFEATVAAFEAYEAKAAVPPTEQADRARVVAEVLGNKETEPTSIEQARQQQILLVRELRDLSVAIPELHRERAALKPDEKRNEQAAMRQAIQEWVDAEAEPVILKDKHGNTVNDSEGRPLTYPSTHEPVFSPNGEPQYSTNHELILRRKPPIFSETAIAAARQKAKKRIEAATRTSFTGQMVNDLAETAQGAGQKVGKVGAQVKREPVYALLQGASYAASEAPFDVVSAGYRATAWTGKKILSTPYYGVKFAAVASANFVGEQWNRRKIKKEARTTWDEVPADLGSSMANAVDTLDRLDKIEALQERIAKLDGWINAAEKGGISAQGQLDSRTAALKRELDAGQQAGQSDAEYAAFVEDRKKHLIEQNVLARQLTLATEASLQGVPKPDAQAVNKLLMDGRPLESLFLTDTDTGAVHFDSLGQHIELSGELMEQQQRFANLEVTHSRSLRDAARKLLRRNNGNPEVAKALAADNFKLTITPKGEIAVTTWITQANELTGATETLISLSLDASTSAGIFKAIETGQLDENGHILEDVLKKLDASGEAFLELDKTLEQNTEMYADVNNAITDFQKATKPLEDTFDQNPANDSVATALQHKHAELAQTLRLTGGELSKAGVDDLQNVIDANARQAEQMAKLYGDCASQEDIDSATLTAITDGRAKRRTGFVELTDNVQTTQHGKAEGAFTKASAAPERATVENVYKKGDTIKLPNKSFTGKTGEGTWKVLSAEHGVYLLELQNTKPGEVVLHLTVTNENLKAWQKQERAKKPGQAEKAEDIDTDSLDLDDGKKTPDTATSASPIAAKAEPVNPATKPIEIVSRLAKAAATTVEPPTATEKQPDAPEEIAATTMAEVPDAVPAATPEPPTEAEPVAELPPLVVAAEAAEQPVAAEEQPTAADELPDITIAEVPDAVPDAVPENSSSTAEPAEAAPSIIIQESPEPTSPAATPEVAPEPEEAPTTRAA